MPDTRLSLALNLGGIALFVASLIALLVLHAATHGGETDFELTGGDLILAGILTVALVVASMGIHEWIHGLAIRRAGGTPTYGARLVGNVMPVLYCTADGHLFTRTQFIGIALAPLVV
ncbi:MAG: DUF3267 domain-containing protein, partial [Thermomicrobiales bacterium]|nr:DUF3267 domain-containing protein [Thermomicrobiales bacterium]